MNYQQLQELYSELAPRGFTVLAFPCNQFGKQESGTEEEIKAFVTTKYNVTFPMFAKIKVNGTDAEPLWKYLKANLTGTFGQSIKWNFTKFLVDRKGIPVARYGTPTNPKSIRNDILTLLEGGKL